MRRRTKFQPIGGALACSCASSAAYSAGSASGTVDRNCATFISGPFRPPRMVRRSSACAARSVLMPNTRSPATRAAMPPTAPEVRAMRRISPNRLLRSDMRGKDGGGGRVEVSREDSPSPCGRGLGGGGARAVQPIAISIPSRFRQHFAIGNPHDTNVLCFAIHASRTASAGASICDTPSTSTTSRGGRAVEVGDVRSERHSAGETSDPPSLMLAKPLPQLSFRRRWSAAH